MQVSHRARAVTKLPPESVYHYHNPTSPRSLARHATCALFAASATRLKSFKKGAVSGVPPPSPLWPRYVPATVCVCGIRACWDGCEDGACCAKPPKSAPEAGCALDGEGRG